MKFVSQMAFSKGLLKNGSRLGVRGQMRLWVITPAVLVVAWSEMFPRLKISGGIYTKDALGRCFTW